MGSRRNWVAMLYGLTGIVVILLVISLFLSLLLHLSAVKESSVQWVLLPMTLLSLFIGGAIAGFRSGQKGWYVGGMTGVLFLLLIWLISYLGFNTALSVKSTVIYVSYLLLTILGGMIGVNISPHRD
ncbi:TIGR04086 family membrane protein [Caldalkalibacillus salinus]|uniref:TIGR04086 family membrane protein n=1 Tax=Caldalkalibacillus salinus TaxID=2803787 RepID=UPI001921B855|nr:TIGR04086 family membrane protein [Caldalkalibacillus salinus]